MVSELESHVTGGDSEKIQYKNISKSERDGGKLGLCSLTGALMVLACVGCEIGKQVSNYSINYFNGGKYPLPQTLLVVVLEILKLFATLIRMRCRIPSLDRAHLKSSLKFVIPSAIYAINNNIYLAGLILVPPPIWVILCSVRTVVTTALYKFALKRDVTPLQFIGAALIVASIIVAKLGDVLSSEAGNSIPILAIIYAALSSMNSVGVSVYQEQLFKNSGENFLDQQFWLYFYGVIVSSLGHLSVSNDHLPGDHLEEAMSASTIVQLFLILGLFFSSIGGLVVASILKKLDNVVKEYSYSTANMFTAVICALFFPDKFTITVFILFSMGFLFAGIYCYEKKTFSVPVESNSCPSAQEKGLK